MNGDRLLHAREAVAAAIDQLRDRDRFCVIAGAERGVVVSPLLPATLDNRTAAKEAVGRLSASGGTVMSRWLDAARKELAKAPGAIRHAVLLADGKNEGEADEVLAAAVGRCVGLFQCDARGVGTDWVPDQLRLVTTRLLGTLDVIPQTADIPADVRRVLGAALGRAVDSVALRVWAPTDTAVVFCRQVHPAAVDLSELPTADQPCPQIHDYPTGAWGDETRDYHLCVRIPGGQPGHEVLAAWLTIVRAAEGRESTLAEARVLIRPTADPTQAGKAHPVVAHYARQAELANAVREGLRARDAGDDERAAALLGRAVKLAADGLPETRALLRQVVEVVDEATGTVRLLDGADRATEFVLNTRSAKTVAPDLTIREA
jgi:hypothetical protein